MGFIVFKWLLRNRYVRIENGTRTTRTVEFRDDMQGLLRTAWELADHRTVLMVSKVTGDLHSFCELVEHASCGDFAAEPTSDGSVALKFVRHGFPEPRLAGPLACVAKYLA